MKAKTAKSIAKDAAREAIDEFNFQTREYSNPSFSVLRINFAEGSEPRVIDIPYQPFSNRTDVNLPYRLVKAEEEA